MSSGQRKHKMTTTGCIVMPAIGWFYGIADMPGIHFNVLSVPDSKG